VWFFRAHSSQAEALKVILPSDRRGTHGARLPESKEATLGDTSRA